MVDDSFVAFAGRENRDACFDREVCANFGDASRHESAAGSVARVDSASIFHAFLLLLFGAVVEVMPGVELGKEQHFANG